MTYDLNMRVWRGDRSGGELGDYTNLITVTIKTDSTAKPSIQVPVNGRVIGAARNRSGTVSGSLNTNTSIAPGQST